MARYKVGSIIWNDDNSVSWYVYDSSGNPMYPEHARVSYFHKRQSMAQKECDEKNNTRD